MKKTIKLIIFMVIVLLAIVLLQSKVFATTIEDVLEEGKIVVKSVPPTNESEGYFVSELVSYEYEGYYIDASTYNSTYTKANIVSFDGNVEKEVEIVYEYDKDVKKVVDSIIAKLPDEQTDFTLTDMEYIKYILDTGELVVQNPEDEISIATYCSELKKFIDYKNFVIEPRMGDDGYFFTYKAGNATFKYEGTVYGYVDKLGVYAKAAVYVKDDETDIVNTIKERVSKLCPDVEVKVEKTDFTIEEFLQGEENAFGYYYDESPWLQQGFATKDAYIETMMDEYYYNEDAPCHFLLDAEANTYGMQIGDLMLEFAVIKDSSKVSNDLELVTNDVNTNITISTTSKSIPLDTLISVAKVTSGEEYEKIIKILDVTNSETFDLKLFSKSAGDYITKLDDGTFEVKIPISESLKGKDLTVYYVNKNDVIEEYEVTIKDGYAIFNTDHFTIYTLAEKAESETETKEEEKGEKDNTPKTGTVDIMGYVITLTIMSALGIVILKKNN